MDQDRVAKLELLRWGQIASWWHPETGDEVRFFRDGFLEGYERLTGKPQPAMLALWQAHRMARACGYKRVRM